MQKNEDITTHAALAAWSLIIYCTVWWRMWLEHPDLGLALHPYRVKWDNQLLGCWRCSKKDITEDGAKSACFKAIYPL